MSDLGNIDETVLLFGGPYSNYAATVAMQARAQALAIPPQRIICTGDVIAYCGEPGETLELIRDWGVNLVMGNCEESLALGEDDCGCGFDADSECSLLAVTWYDYARRRISAGQRSWMRNLSRQIDFSMAGNRFRVTHAGLDSINEFVFASTDSESRLARMRQCGLDVVIGGHCGIPFGQQLQDRCWLNAGVIGMPANDGGRHGWYMLLEPGVAGIEVSWHRLEYDYASSQSSTLAAGMTAYGQTLADGLWPNVDILPVAEVLQTGQPLDLPPLHIASAPDKLHARDDAVAN